MIKTVIATVLTMLVLCFPLKHEVTINKSQINSLRPFAGTINGELVGTELCVQYWLHHEYQPEVATYEVWYPMVFGVFGYVYNVNLK